MESKEVKEVAYRCQGCFQITCTSLMREYGCEKCNGRRFSGCAKWTEEEEKSLQERLNKLFTPTREEQGDR